MKITVTSDDGKKVVEVPIDDLSGVLFLNRVLQRRVGIAMNDVANYEHTQAELLKELPNDA